MNIEAGRRYFRRDGAISGIITANPTSAFPWVDEEKGYRYTITGAIHLNPEQITLTDLIHEWDNSWCSYNRLIDEPPVAKCNVEVLFSNGSRGDAVAGSLNWDASIVSIIAYRITSFVEDRVEEKPQEKETLEFVAQYNAYIRIVNLGVVAPGLEAMAAYSNPSQDSFLGVFTREIQ